MWAAAGVIIAARGRVEGAASPTNAEVTVLIDTTACASLGATVVIITNGGGFDWGWRGWTRVWRV